MREAGALARKTAQGAFRHWTKGEDKSPVTEADIAVNDLLHQQLTALCPGAGWLSEETAEIPASTTLMWIVDPIDGTREVMYQKRSAWVLTGVAPNRGEETNLQDIELAVQTEIPLLKQHLCDTLWAIRGKGVGGERFNRLAGERKSLAPRPSRATTIRHGFAMVARFFPGARDELAAIDEEIVQGALGAVEPGKAHCFEDQYLSSGGQLYELMMGHDRFIADLRPLVESVLNRRGRVLGICCHPYDVCTELIAREAGVIVTDEHGDLLRAPLRVEPDVTWIGYANEAIRREIEPWLREALKKRGVAIN